MPSSRMVFRAIGRLEQQFGGQLRFVFRHLLTGTHPHALVAAHLAEAAALQGRFWPMHKLLLATSRPRRAPTCWAMPTSWGWTVCGSASTWTAKGCGGGFRPTALLGPRPCSPTAGGTWAACDQATLGAALPTASRER
jgi:hypothetical protein